MRRHSASVQIIPSALTASAEKSHRHLNPKTRVSTETAVNANRYHLHSKRACGNWHGPYERGSNTLPKPSRALQLPRLRETIPHGLEPLLCNKAFTLHLALHNIKWITRYPEHLASKTTVECDPGTRDLFSRDVIAPHVGVHKILECEKPTTIGLRFTQESDCGATVQAFKYPFARGEFLDAVKWATVEAFGAMGLSLQSDPHVFDWRA
jgi:hypothetical protein